MRVFKTYFKVIKQYYPIILTYTFIFFGVSIIFAMNYSSNQATNFTASKPNIAFFNYDKESLLLKDFQDYLKENANIINIEDNADSIADALFYRRVTYVVKIPTDFTTKFMNGEDVALEVKQVPDSASTVYARMLVNRYFEDAHLYQVSGIDEATMITKIREDLDKETTVSVIDNTKQISALESINYYYNYTNYVFLAILILIIGLVTKAFKEEDIYKRNLCSPIKREQINKEIILGNFVITIGIWLVFVIGSIIFSGTVMFTKNGLLLILNSLIFALTALSISSLITIIVKNSEAQSAIANVVSLGSSFISGAFVPQMLLSSSVLSFSKFFPSFWFIRGNDLIATSTLNSSVMNSIIICMLIQIGFMFIFYMITMVISRYRKHMA